MKKLSFVTLTVLTLSLSACSNSAGGESTSPGAESTAITTGTDETSAPDESTSSPETESPNSAQTEPATGGGAGADVDGSDLDSILDASAEAMAGVTSMHATMESSTTSDSDSMPIFSAVTEIDMTSDPYIAYAVSEGTNSDEDSAPAQVAELYYFEENGEGVLVTSEPGEGWQRVDLTKPPYSANAQIFDNLMEPDYASLKGLENLNIEHRDGQYIISGDMPASEGLVEGVIEVKIDAESMYQTETYSSMTIASGDTEFSTETRFVYRDVNKVEPITIPDDVKNARTK